MIVIRARTLSINSIVGCAARPDRERARFEEIFDASQRFGLIDGDACAIRASLAAIDRRDSCGLMPVHEVREKLWRTHAVRSSQLLQTTVAATLAFLLSSASRPLVR